MLSTQWRTGRRQISHRYVWYIDMIIRQRWLLDTHRGFCSLSVVSADTFACSSKTVAVTQQARRSTGNELAGADSTLQ